MGADVVLDLADSMIGGVTVDPEHHPLGPSTFERTDLCPGSPALNARLPASQIDPRSASAQGVRAHALLEHCAKQHEWDASPYTGFSLDGLSPQHPRAAPVYTKDDTDAVTIALRHIESLLDKDSILFLEQKLDLSIALPGLFGRGDAGALQPVRRHFDAVEYKHGAGVSVRAKDSMQLKGYMLGWLRKLLVEYAIDTITFWVIQPRLQPPHPEGPIQRVDYSVLDILDWVPKLKNIIARAQDPNAPRIPGVKQCQFCEGAKQLKCPEYVAANRKAVTAPFTYIASFDGREIGQLLEDVPLLRQFVKNVEARAEELARSGQMPIDPRGITYKWIAGRGGDRAWALDDDQVIEVVKARAGVDISIRTVESPAQAEKLIGKKQLAAICAAFEAEVKVPLTTRGPGKPKLVKGDHEKPAISLEEVRAAASTAAFTEIETP